MPSDSDLMEIQQPIQPNATSVDVTCPHCDCTEEHQASAWHQKIEDRFSLAAVDTYGVICSGCHGKFCFRLTPAVHPWPLGSTLDVTCPACSKQVATQLATVRQLDKPYRPESCGNCHHFFGVRPDGSIVTLTPNW